MEQFCRQDADETVLYHLIYCKPDGMLPFVVKYEKKKIIKSLWFLFYQREQHNFVE
jgi:hypothetical protein